MRMLDEVPVKKNRLVVDRDNVFARMLDFYMDLEFINDRELSEKLGIPITDVIDMRLGIIWGIVTPNIINKLEKALNTEPGLFKDVLKETILVEDNIES